MTDIQRCMHTCGELFVILIAFAMLVALALSVMGIITAYRRLKVAQKTRDEAIKQLTASIRHVIIYRSERRVVEQRSDDRRQVIRRQRAELPQSFKRSPRIRRTRTNRRYFKRRFE